MIFPTVASAPAVAGHHLKPARLIASRGIGMSGLVGLRAAGRFPGGQLLKSRYYGALPVKGRTICWASGGREDSPSKAPVDSEGRGQEAVENDTSKGANSEVAAAQRTAIATGVFSIVIAIGYLALAQLLGNRELLPPPPEALGL